jgi:hypothetical protein
MTTKSETFTNDLVGTCFICKRRHDNLAYGEPYQPLKWVCWPCLTTVNIKKAYHMRLDRYEEQALEDGGNAGGGYLDSLGRTDLASLEPGEWSHFLGIVLKGYAESMRDIVSREVPY